MSTPRSPQDLLIQTYQRAYLRILDDLIAAASADRSTAYYQALLADLDDILRGLDSRAQTWIEQQMPAIYAAGMQAAISGLEAAGVENVARSSMTGIHRSAVEILALNMYGDLTGATATMGRTVNDLFRQTSLEAVAQKVATGQTIPQSAKALQQALADKGVTAFTDKAGRNWRLDTYSEMVVRSSTREATNHGTLNQLTSLGYDLVTIPPHSPTCNICAPYQGRIYSISGKDTRFPPLWNTAFAGGYGNIHPRCSHVVVPYVEVFADDVAGDIARSNQPFDVDPRLEAERQVFAHGQAKKRAANQDFNQWQRYRERLPNDVPTLAGFRRMKAANSPKYQALQQRYRDAGNAINTTS